VEGTLSVEGTKALILAARSALTPEYKYHLSAKQGSAGNAKVFHLFWKTKTSSTWIGKRDRYTFDTVW
jgi:hypothetical protein